MPTIIHKNLSVDPRLYILNRDSVINKHVIFNMTSDTCEIPENVEGSKANVILVSKDKVSEQINVNEAISESRIWHYISIARERTSNIRTIYNPIEDERKVITDLQITVPTVLIRFSDAIPNDSTFMHHVYLLNVMPSSGPTLITYINHNKNCKTFDNDEINDLRDIADHVVEVNSYSDDIFLNTPYSTIINIASNKTRTKIIDVIEEVTDQVNIINVDIVTIVPGSKVNMM